MDLASLRSVSGRFAAYVSRHGFDQGLEELLVVRCVAPLKMVEVANRGAQPHREILRVGESHWQDLRPALERLTISGHLGFCDNPAACRGRLRQKHDEEVALGDLAGDQLSKITPGRNALDILEDVVRVQERRT